jgi:ATP-dependent protease ClpP protease subunit
MAEILLYGVIGDAFDKLDAATVTTAIRAASGPLAVRINSPGGYVMEGLAIIEALRAYPSKVTIHIDGLAASMASAIAMVGTETIMAESALMMIHKPWDSSIGNAEDLRRDAAKLDRIEAQMIGIYAKRTGLPEGEIATMLAAETWFSPEEALAAGFVTSIAAPLKLAAMADVSAYGFRHTPDRLKEPQMTDTTTAVTAERTRISTIMALCDRHRLPGEFARSLIDRGGTIENARNLILDHLADRDDRINIGHSFSGGGGTLDNPAVYNDALKGALNAKISGRAATGPASEFQGMSVVDMARDFLGRRGERDVLRMSPDRVISMALQSRGGRSDWGLGSASSITQTTSDFHDLIGGAAETYLIERYRRQESQLKLLARERSRSNFLVQFGVQTGGFGTLDALGEAGEYKNKTIASRKEGYRLETFGNMFNVSRQMLVNDHLGALADVLTLMAGAAAEVEATVLASLINSNILMNDGKPWFHSDHRNVAAVGTAPTVQSLDAGRLAMRQQKDLDGVGLIDANPKYMLVPVTLQTAAETLVASTISPTNTNDVNPFAGKLTPIADPRIVSPTAWYLFADPDFSPALQYSYLDGQTTPFLDSQDGWRVDGTEYKVRHDFGAGVMDHRMAWKNPGA